MFWVYNLVMHLLHNPVMLECNYIASSPQWDANITNFKSCNATITSSTIRCKYSITSSTIRCKYYIIINLVMQLLHHPPWRDENPPKFYSIIQHMQQPSGHVNSPPHEPTCVANIFCTFAMRNGTCSRGAQDLHAPLENYIKFHDYSSIGLYLLYTEI